MSMKVNKNGKEYPLGFMPGHYPADRVYLDGDTSKTVQDECVRKTGDTMTGDLTLSKAATVFKIRGSGSRYHNITSAATGSNKDIVLPNKSGTVALVGDDVYVSSTVVKKFLSLWMASFSITGLVQAIIDNVTTDDKRVLIEGLCEASGFQSFNGYLYADKAYGSFLIQKYTGDLYMAMVNNGNVTYRSL